MHDLTKCKVLDTEDDGKTVIQYSKDNRIILCKVNVYTGALPEEVSKSYLSQLRHNFSFSCINTKFVSYNQSWELKQLLVQNADVVYVLFASCSVCDEVHTVEAQFKSALDYYWFLSNFDDFVSSVDFHEIHQEVGILTFNDHSVRVVSVSDLVLQKSHTTDVLLFVGKDKFFCISVTTKSQQQKLTAAKNVQQISKELYHVIGIDGTVTGVIELHSSTLDDAFIEVFGYWLPNTQACIEDNVILAVS